MVLFTVWWVISVCNQFRAGAWTLRLRRHIPFGVIPLWTFFAPNPARADSRLIWREQHGDKWDDWREMHFGFAPVGIRWLINSNLILNKAINDLVSSLLKMRPELEDRSDTLSAPYLTLMCFVLDQPRITGCSSVQFAIVRSSLGLYERHVEIAFLSEVHQVVDSTYVHQS